MFSAQLFLSFKGFTARFIKIISFLVPFLSIKIYSQEIYTQVLLVSKCNTYFAILKKKSLIFCTTNHSLILEMFFPHDLWFFFLFLWSLLILYGSFMFSFLKFGIFVSAVMNPFLLMISTTPIASGAVSMLIVLETIFWSHIFLWAFNPYFSIRAYLLIFIWMFLRFLKLNKS